MNNIKEWRKKRGLSQLAIAEIMGCTQGYICSIENERLRLTPEIAERLSEVLECSVDELTGRGEDYYKDQIERLTKNMNTWQLNKVFEYAYLIKMMKQNNFF